MNLVKLERDGKCAEIVLSRPEKLNALNAAMMDEFTAALEEVGADDSVSCVIVRGDGRAFSVGFDISSDDGGQTANAYLDWFDLRQRLTRWIAVHDLSKPVIASVHGFCLGGATMLAACCDITFVSETAEIGWPSIPLGGGLLSPVSMWLIGPQRAKELSFIARSSMSGIEARDLRWAVRALPESELLDETRRVADEIAKTPLTLLRIKKLALNRVLDMQGFRESVFYGAEWDAVAHTAPENVANFELIERLGVKGAIASFHGE
jgi:enoyl-CoA hydratase